MHGESTQALSKEQAVLAGTRREARRRGFWGLGEALVCSRKTKE